MPYYTRASSLATRIAFTLCIISSVVACGMKDQSTPEPGDRAKIEQIAEELGMNMTYDPNTIEMTVKQPDGPILLRWEDRRAQTLSGTLPAWEVKADFNPGSIKNTLAWEMNAERVSDQQHTAAMRNSMTPEQRACSDWAIKGGSVAPPACLNSMNSM